MNRNPTEMGLRLEQQLFTKSVFMRDLSASPGSTSSPQRGGPSHPSAPAGPQGLRKHFLRGKLDCDNQPPDPDRLFQRCFMATVTSVNVEGPA